MTKIILDGDQLDAKEKLHDWLRRSPSEVGNIFRLRGTAGSGKTTMLAEACQVLKPKTTALVAPTHKALSVVSPMGAYADTKNTLTGLLGLKPKRVGLETKLIRKSKFDMSELYKYQTVVVDEADMVDLGHWKFLNQAIDLADWRVILSGDPCQLPPVNEVFSTCSRLDLDSNAQAELTKTRRFGDGVLNFADKVRDKIITGSGLIEWEDSIGSDNLGVRFLSEKQFQSDVREKLVEMKQNKDPNHCKIVSYTNAKAIDYDRRAAKVLGYTPETGFSVGDQVMVKTAYVNANEELLLSTGEDLVVLKVKPSVHYELGCLIGQSLTVQKDNGDVVDIEVLNSSCTADYEKILKDYAKIGGETGEWIKYIDLASHYADIRYGIGLTVHQAQGSTFTNVFCDLSSIYPSRRQRRPDWDEKLADRLLYTAVTRGKNVYIF